MTNSAYGLVGYMYQLISGASSKNNCQVWRSCRSWRRACFSLANVSWSSPPHFGFCVSHPWKISSIASGLYLLSPFNLLQNKRMWRCCILPINYDPHRLLCSNVIILLSLNIFLFYSYSLHSAYRRLRIQWVFLPLRYKQPTTTRQVQTSKLTSEDFFAFFPWLTLLVCESYLVIFSVITAHMGIDSLCKKLLFQMFA